MSFSTGLKLFMTEVKGPACKVYRVQWISERAWMHFDLKNFKKKTFSNWHLVLLKLYDLTPQFPTDFDSAQKSGEKNVKQLRTSVNLDLFLLETGSGVEKMLEEAAFWTVFVRLADFTIAYHLKFFLKGPHFCLAMQQKPNCRKSEVK